MRVLEILNAYPGETFLREHATAILSHTDIRLAWAFTQSNRAGRLRPHPVQNLSNTIGLTNPNRLSSLDKTFLRLRYFNTNDSYGAAWKSQIRRLNPDIVHFHFASLAARHFPAMRELGIPFTFSIRGSDIQVDPVVRGEEYVARLKETTAAAVGAHAVTEDLKETFNRVVGCRNSHLQVIRTCVSTAWSNVVRSPKGNLFLAVGRLHWRKGFADLLIAAAGLKRRGLDFSLIIVGEGPERSRLSFMINDLGLRDCVQLKGNLDHRHLLSYMEQAGWFVLSSLQEGFPNVLAEAIIARVPVITTNLPGILEVLEGSTRALVAKVAVPESLEASMVEALTMSAERAAGMADAAYKVAQPLFSGEAHASHFESFWRKCLSSNGLLKSA